MFSRSLEICYKTERMYVRNAAAKKVHGWSIRISSWSFGELLFRTRAHSAAERKNWIRRVSGRNQLVGRIDGVRISGLMAEVKLAIADQQITSIITASSAREMQLKPGQAVAALIKGD